MGFLGQSYVDSSALGAVLYIGRGHHPAEGDHGANTIMCIKSSCSYSLHW